jgi:hypothetical protein
MFRYGRSRMIRSVKKFEDVGVFGGGIIDKVIVTIIHAVHIFTIVA